jgi:hypothetical protein
MKIYDHRIIRRAIKDVLESVAGTGKVHLYERYSSNSGKFKALYLDDKDSTERSDDIISGWYIRRVATKDTQVNRDSHHEVSTDWELFGYRSMKDDEASELEFDDVIDAVMDRFRRDEYLGNSVIGLGEGRNYSPRIITQRPVKFGGYTCHEVRIGITTLSHVDLPEEEWPGDHPQSDLTQVESHNFGISPEIGPDHIDDYTRVGLRDD